MANKEIEERRGRSHGQRRPGRGKHDAKSASLLIDLDLGHHSPALARRLVQDLLPSHPGLGDIVLATSELVTNAVRHSGHERGWLRVVTKGTTVRVEVGHPGAYFAPPEPSTLDDPTGRGLRIVASVADRWGVEAGEETVVWFELDEGRDD